MSNAVGADAGADATRRYDDVMRRDLALHPDSVCAAVERLAAQAERLAGGRLSVRFVLDGRLSDIVLPPPAAPDRTDELWRRTCFEAFVRPEGAEGYWEFNLSPSSQWAAYRFDGRRQGMRPVELPGGPQIVVERTKGGFALSAVLALEAADDLALRLGLSAVVETARGVTYWALAHPPGRPDFHHPDCFALQLPATERP